MGITFTGSDVLWYVLAAVLAASALGFIASVRRCLRWGARHAKAGFLDWFREAVDEHVQPRFDAVKQNNLDAAVLLRKEMAADAVLIKEELRVHTDEEAAMVHTVVEATIAPVVARLSEHLVADERAQELLLAQMADQHAENQERFAAIETVTKETREELQTPDGVTAGELLTTVAGAAYAIHEEIVHATGEHPIVAPEG